VNPHDSAQIDWVSFPGGAALQASAPYHAKASPGASAWQARRDAGMAAAQAHADTDCPEWTDLAAAFLRDYAALVGGAFLVEQARIAALHRVPTPENLKAWGPAAVKAVRKGWIVKAGYGPASSSNGSPKTLFRGVA